MNNSMKTLIHCNPWILLSFLHLILLTGGESHGLVEQPAYISVELGGNVTIECKVLNLISYIVFWTRENEENSPIKNEGRVSFDSSERKIHIKSVTELDSGIYFCHVEDIDKKTVKGNGTRLHVRKACSSESNKVDDADTDNEADINVHILFGVIVLQTAVIIFLMVFVFRRPHTAPTPGANKLKEDRRSSREEIHYAEIMRNRPQSSRTRDV